MLTPSTTKPSPDEHIGSLSPSQNHSADQVAGEKGDSSDGADAVDDSKLSLPVQKRRRVTRACDECRRKKIKCDGKQPCTHCTVYSYECTYDQPSNRRRNPAPHYIEALEQRLQKAEAILRAVLPGVDIDDPKFDAHGVDQIVHSSERHDQPKLPATTEAGEDSQMQPMVDRIGSLDLDDQGNWDFHGHSSGFAFMRRLRAQFGEQLLPYPSHLKSRNISQLLESPRSAQSSPYDTNLSSTIDLPSKEAAIELCRNTLDDCCALMHPLHRPTFFRKLHSIYDTEPDQYDNAQLKFLPLLYVVMGLGCLFSRTENENSMLDLKGYKEAIEQGYHFFQAGKQMLDITDCRDLITIQTIFFMILFLQSSAKLATCYAYIGIALRACCRLGLHRDLPGNFDPIESEERKRIFWLIRKIDTYVGAILGLPQMLSDDDIDQKFPSDINDEYITSEGISPMPEGAFPLIKATNAHTKLTLILRKVVKYVYPIKGAPGLVSGDNYTVSHGRIRELEQELQEWMQELPSELKPSEDASMELSRVQQLLRISYAHVQMMMYRPFIHYVSQACQMGNADKRSYACAAACVSVARNIVHITTEMKRRGLLVGAYWFVMYTTYFAIVSLAYFALENPNSKSCEDILKDAQEGRDTLASLAKRSLAADRCTTSLSSLFNELPDKLQERRSSMASPTSGKKRQAPSDSGKLQGKQSTPDVNIPTREGSMTPHRARTLPHDHLAKIAKRNSMPDPPSFNTTNQGQKPQLMNLNSPIVASPLSQNLEFTPPASTGQIPDLKNVMFPSDNPFAYPNQPISTLESVDIGYNITEMDSFTGSNDNSMMGTSTSILNSAHPQQQQFDIQQLYEESPQMLQQLAGRHFGAPAPIGFQGQDVQQLYEMPNMQPQGVEGQQEDYWTQMSKGDIGTRTGFTPGASVNLDELFGGDGWGGNVWVGQQPMGQG